MTPVTESNLLCVMIGDSVEVTEFCRRLTRENELLRERVAELEDANGCRNGDAASRARSAANAYMNRGG